MDFETDINILRNLRFPGKALTIRLIWSMLTEHKNKIKNIDDLLDRVMR